MLNLIKFTYATEVTSPYQGHNPPPAWDPAFKEVYNFIKAGLNE